MAYITFTDIRNEGLTADPPTDAAITSAIVVCEQLIDRITRQWFESRAVTFKLDGVNGDTLHLPVPIINIDHVRLNDDTEDLDPGLFRVYNGRLLPDDRRNPRIKLISHERHHDIFSRPLDHHHRLKFRKGRQNQEIKGDFGFVELDGSTPEAIRRAAKILVIEKLQSPLFVDTAVTPVLSAPPPLLGNLLEEKTDGHSRKYAQAGGPVEKRPAGLSGITDNKEFHDIIRLYKAPISVHSPTHFGHD